MRNEKDHSTKESVEEDFDFPLFSRCQDSRRENSKENLQEQEGRQHRTGITGDAAMNEREKRHYNSLQLRLRLGQQSRRNSGKDSLKRHRENPHLSSFSPSSGRIMCCKDSSNDSNHYSLLERELRERDNGRYIDARE
jgi:hypothetical protein